MMVNLAAFVRCFLRAERKTLWNFLAPVLGFLICAGLWWNLSSQAKEIGFLWMALGIVLSLWITRGYRVPLAFEVPEE
jgi:hypothetical protein